MLAHSGDALLAPGEPEVPGYAGTGRAARSKRAFAYSRVWGVFPTGNTLNPISYRLS